MKKLINKYNKIREKLLALGYFANLTSWDMQTEAPSDSASTTSKYLGELMQMEHKIKTSKALINTVNELYENRDSLDSALAHEIVEMRKSIINEQKIPLAEQLEFNMTVNEGYGKYVSAKTNDNYSEFLPTLNYIVDYNKKLAKWLEEDDKKGYDVLLDMYEPNFSMAKYDEFFELLRTRLVPFVKKIASLPLPYDSKLDELRFPVEGQKQFCEYLLDVMKFDKSIGLMKQSEHPFTTSLHHHDVRITNHYYEDNILSSIFSVIHEGGHALYEQNIDEKLHGTLCCGGASLGLHESQSRFYENIIGRSYSFWQKHYGKLQEVFAEQLSSVTLDEFYKYVNAVKCDYIRTEADELTYPLHIMLRYDMEKAFIEGDLTAKDFPKQWDKLFNDYFGLTPPTDREGVLQDVHWAYGNVGYFPTYALGSAIASQLFAHMKNDFDVDKALVSGTTEQINNWLHKHVHCYGSSKYPTEIIELAVGEQFDANYYVDYLIEKYSKVYGIN